MLEIGEGCGTVETIKKGKMDDCRNPIDFDAGSDVSVKLYRRVARTANARTLDQTTDLLCILYVVYMLEFHNESTEVPTLCTPQSCTWSIL